MLYLKLFFMFSLALFLFCCSENSTESTNDDSVDNDPGNALLFDGDDDYAWAAPNISNVDEATVELWFRPDSFGQYQPLLTGGIDHPGGNWDNGYYFGTHGSSGEGLSFGFWTGRWNWQQTNVIPTNGQWYHMAATWGPDGIKTYINGRQTNDYPYLGANQEYNIDLLGCSSWANYFHGAIDEVRYWNVARDSVQLNKTMYHTLGNEYTTSGDSGLIAYYKFDLIEDLGIDIDGEDDIKDYSVSGNHADTRGDPLLIESGAFSKSNGD